MVQVKISWQRGLTQTFDRFDVYIDEAFIRNFAPTQGHESVQLAAGPHTLHIEATGLQHAVQDIPFEVSKDVELVIKRKLTAVKPHFYLEIS